jgi:8-oxo-dGTP pyrophosphatase MutT (NUDIX family)
MGDGIVHSARMGAADLPSGCGWSRSRGDRAVSRFVPLARLRRLRGTEQVAAICYRVRNRTIEFLLVQTRGGRWIFPKGSAEPGLTRAQAAALEAFEEAGVHGRMEEASFTRYVRREGEGGARVVVHAHLCEVQWLDSPPEFDRDPTWFPLNKAKRRLRERRARDFGNDLARVLDCAVARIQQLHRGPTIIDSQQKVFFIDSAGKTDNLSLKSKRMR